MGRPPSHLYVAAQAHGCGDHAEVHALDLADSRGVVGLDWGRGHGAQLNQKKEKGRIWNNHQIKIH